jgi:hypothetical protein
MLAPFLYVVVEEVVGHVEAVGKFGLHMRVNKINRIDRIKEQKHC